MSSSSSWRLYFDDESYFHHRFLAGGDDSGLDYTVLSVGVTTLGLILCVEMARHQLDVRAVGRPFFKTVLEGVYRELATLGIVEFIIFLLHKYYENLDVPKEVVFADVHFTLFYTALINALQSVLLAIVVIRNSNREWVAVEYQDAHHYVEIREEFDRIHAELEHRTTTTTNGDDDDEYEMGHSEEEEEESSKKKRRYKKKNTTNNNNNHLNDSFISTSLVEIPFQYSWNGIKSMYYAMIWNIQYPHLFRKHQRLLQQLRFHELKYHFLESHNLPLNLTVSDYLKRSELHVLTKLVHISTFAWLLLTGMVALIYYFMSIVLYVTEGNTKMVGKALSGIFLITLVVFVMISLIIFNKMKHIFRAIMNMKLTNKQGQDFIHHTNGTNDDETTIKNNETQNNDQYHYQLSLFWGGHPRYITIFIQFMQFGYAVFGSILLVFWDDVDSSDSLPAWFFLIVVIICYGFFVLIMGEVIPRFTLCSCLGQLVNQHRLQETLATYKLEQAKRKRQQEQEELLWGKQFDWAITDDDDEEGEDDDQTTHTNTTSHTRSGATTPIQQTTLVPPPPNKTSSMPLPVTKKSSLSGAPPLPPQKTTTILPSPFTAGRKALELLTGQKLMDRTTSMDPDSARSSSDRLASMAGSSSNDTTTTIRTVSSHERIKTTTEDENVLLIQSLMRTETKELRKNLPSRYHHGKRRKSMSDGVEAMRAMSKMNLDEDDEASTMSMTAPTRARRRRNRTRTRAVSAMASIQAMRAATIKEEEPEEGKELKRSSSDPDLSKSFKNKKEEEAEEQQSSTATTGGGATERLPTMRRPRRRRLKSASASADIRSMRNFTIKEESMESDSSAPRLDAPVRTMSGVKEESNTSLLNESSNASIGLNLDADDDDNKKDVTNAFFAAPSVATTTTTTQPPTKVVERSRLTMSMPPQATATTTMILDDDDDEPVDKQPATAVAPTTTTTAVAATTSPRDETVATSLDDDDIDEDIDDDHSDAGDIPMVAATTMQQQQHHDGTTTTRNDTRNALTESFLQHVDILNVSDVLRAYFRSRRFAFSSFVFGTLACFLVIGMRLEVLLVDSCLLPNLDNTWHFQRNHAFWTEFVIFILMIGVDMIIFLLYCSPKHQHDSTDRATFMGAILDILLVCTCIAFLMIAEVQRCCHGGDDDDGDYSYIEKDPLDDQYEDGNYEDDIDGRRYLAAGDYEKDYECNPYDAMECKCETFGNRLYGGVGNLEPFTALIALRLLRFYISRRIVTFINRKNHHHQEEEENPAMTTNSKRHPLEPLFDKAKHVQKHSLKTLNGKEGTVVELWRTALEIFPNIVEKHGEFSSELLQAMLGIEVIEGVDSTTDGPNMMPGGISLTPEKSMRLSDLQRRASDGSNGGGRCRVPKRQSIACAKEYPNLDADARAIILSGEWGVAVEAKQNRQSYKNNYNSSVNIEFDNSMATIHGQQQQQQQQQQYLHRKISKFEAVFFSDHEMNSQQDVDLFYSPNSLLIRSMRRCDRKLLPLLGNWTTVDLVMTKYEMVYFEAVDYNNDDDDFIEEDDDDEDARKKKKRIKAVRDAMIATKGGKGLRLRDVAFGRKVIGIHKLSEIQSLYVERTMPTRAGDESFFSTGIFDTHVCDEYWKDAPSKSHSSSSRDARWRAMKRDCLKVEMGGHPGMTSSILLLLRFYSDLENCESNKSRMMKEDEVSGPLFKNNAFQWCQTLARLCGGTSQLKQKLIHYGQDNDEELRDYLIVIRGGGTTDMTASSSEEDFIRKKRLRRIASRNALNNNTDRQQQSNNIVTQSLTRGSSAGSVSLKSKSALRRVTSLGDDLVSGTSWNVSSPSHSSHKRAASFYGRSKSFGE